MSTFDNREGSERLMFINERKCNTGSSIYPGALTENQWLKVLLFRSL